MKETDEEREQRQAAFVREALVATLQALPGEIPVDVIQLGMMQSAAICVMAPHPKQRAVFEWAHAEFLGACQQLAPPGVDLTVPRESRRAKRRRKRGEAH